MSDRDDIARIRAYLREHGTTYERAALRARLIADGHSAPTIDLAIAQEYGFPETDTQSAFPRSTRVPLVALGVILANYLALPLLIGVLAQLVNAASFGAFLIGSAALVLLVLTIESVAAAVTRRRNPRLGRGLTWGVLISLLPIIGGGLLLGLGMMLMRIR